MNTPPTGTSVMHTCARCGTLYDWRKSPSELKMTYCGTFCQLAADGILISTLMSAKRTPRILTVSIIDQAEASVDDADMTFVRERMIKQTEHPRWHDDIDNQIQRGTLTGPDPRDNRLASHVTEFDTPVTPTPSDEDDDYDHPLPWED